VIELADKILAIEAALAEAGVPHAFGGALALAFHIAEPRGTRDIDVNVFCTPATAAGVFAALPAGVSWSRAQLRSAERDGQVRLFWDETPVDVFFSTGAFHHRAAERTRRVPFAGTTIEILGATELLVFKAYFDRTKDWADIEEMIAVGSADEHRALGWLVDLLGADDHRVDRLRGLIQDPPNEPS
jgi:hypothetical protein